MDAMEWILLLLLLVVAPVLLGHTIATGLGDDDEQV